MEDKTAFQQKVQSYSQEELLKYYRTLNRVKDPEEFYIVLEEIQAREKKHTSRSPGRIHKASPPKKVHEKQRTQHDTPPPQGVRDDFTPRPHDSPAEPLFSRDEPKKETKAPWKPFEIHPHEPTQDAVFVHDDRVHNIPKWHERKSAGKRSGTEQPGERGNWYHELQPHADADYNDSRYVIQKSSDTHDRSQTSRQTAPKLPKMRRRHHKGGLLTLALGAALYYFAYSLIAGSFYESGNQAISVIFISTLISAGASLMVNLRITEYLKAIWVSIAMTFFIPAALGLAMVLLNIPTEALGLPANDSYVVPSFICIGVSVSVIMGSLSDLKQHY